ncbi:hypothetical protein ACQPYE_28310 [Actinosynnema sp. CA-299493]
MRWSPLMCTASRTYLCTLGRTPTTASDRWAKYGKLGAAGAVVGALVVGAANLDGALSFVERFVGAGESTQTTIARSPERQDTPTVPPTATVSETREQPAVTIADPPPVVTTTRPPAPGPTTTAARPTRAGALVITIKMGSGGKIGPSEYRAGATPGANVDVYDDVGQLSSGCYPSWVLTREDAVVQKIRNGRCTSGGITMFNFNDSLDMPGRYRLQVDVVTDAGQTGSASTDFTVS